MGRWILAAPTSMANSLRRVQGSWLKTRKPTLMGWQVGHAFFDGAEFHGPVDFGSANTKGQFFARGAKFLAEDHEADFNGLKVAQDAFFDGAEFHGPVDFGGADIKGQFGAKGAKFLAPNHKAHFHRMQVGRDAFFQGCDFHGLASFVLFSRDRRYAPCSSC